LGTQVIYVKRSHIEDCKLLLGYLGIPFLTAPDEAEKYCAFLQRNKLVDYTVTDDTDAMTFGCENVIKSSIQGNLIETNYPKLLECLNLSAEKFIDFCILSGCDYCPYIPQIGSLTALALIRKYNSIENVMNSSKYSFPSEYDFNEARKIFTVFEYPVPENFTVGNVNKEALTSFLLEKNFKEIYISRYLKKIIN
jgi:flap endonuclease-1